MNETIPPAAPEVEALIARLKAHCTMSAWDFEPIAQQAAAALAAQAQRIEELLASVKEWACDRCNMVYPGPPGKGLACVMCPHCSGSTMPYETLKLRRAEARVEELEQELDKEVENHQTTIEAWKKESGELTEENDRLSIDITFAGEAARTTITKAEARVAELEAIVALHQLVIDAAQPGAKDDEKEPGS